MPGHMTTVTHGLDETTEVRVASTKPSPTGYKLLIGLPEARERTESGLYKPDTALHTERIATMVGLVVEMGPDAYKDTKKFPSGPYCKEGDWVVFRAFSGTRLLVHGYEMRLINDDTVEAVVEDPHGIERV